MFVHKQQHIGRHVSIHPSTVVKMTVNPFFQGLVKESTKGSSSFGSVLS